MALAVCASAEERKVLSRHLADAKCAVILRLISKRTFPEHSRQCVLSRGGDAADALVVGEEVIAFDRSGCQLARKWLADSKRDEDLRVTVTLRVEEGELTVEKIEADASTPSP